jgi:hypothetical protein
VRGELKWYVDFDTCMLFFAEHHGRAISISDTMLRRRTERPSRDPRVTGSDAAR